MQTQDLIETAVELVPYFKNLNQSRKTLLFQVMITKNALLLAWNSK